MKIMVKLGDKITYVTDQQYAFLKKVYKLGQVTWGEVMLLLEECNFKDKRNALKRFERNGFLKNTNNRYEVTEHGRKVIHKYEQVLNHLRRVGNYMN